MWFVFKLVAFLRFSLCLYHLYVANYNAGVFFPLILKYFPLCAEWFYIVASFSLVVFWSDQLRNNSRQSVYCCNTIFHSLYRTTAFGFSFFFLTKSSCCDRTKWAGLVYISRGGGLQKPWITHSSHSIMGEEGLQREGGGGHVPLCHSCNHVG